MTPDQEKFWDILNQPYNRSCDNCSNLYNSHGTLCSFKLHAPVLTYNKLIPCELKCYEWDKKG